MFKQSISKNGIILAVFAFITAGAIAFTQFSTKGLVEKNVQRALESALFELVPANSHDNQMLDDKLLLNVGVLNNKKQRYAYFAFLENSPLAVVLPATAPNGYGGQIQLIVGIYFNGELAGVRVVPPHNETPGLGDGIEVKKSDWILGFNQKSLANTKAKAWAVKKDGGEFEQMTGATITPRAIVKAVHQSLLYFETNKEKLLLQLSENS